MITSMYHQISISATSRTLSLYKSALSLSRHSRPRLHCMQQPYLTYRALTMGEAPPPPVKEHILCLLPFPERSDILDPIRKKHPNVVFKYHHVTYLRGVAQNLSLTDGKSFLPHFHAWTSHFPTTLSYANINSHSQQKIGSPPPSS